ncbi:LysR family transcriptional regulator [Halomonas elongata]|uniref:LysR family transcriptional regulator n=1 Tax=Halomonas elongata TaxID=2746 RepID=UPI00186BAA8B|nr:LysR family transcriptional regulator [Halomonas elongata]MBW5801325.1 LysR family transcriptional regulator [Halomonas elongata]
MNPSIKQLKSFIAVARSRSLAEASERVHLSQPALSIAIRKLEEAVGGPLFARTTRQLSLTPEGEAFLPVALRLLNDWEEAFEDLGELFSKQRGKITLAALPTLAAGLLPDIIAGFRERYPRINLSLHDVLADEVNLQVREGRADLGFSVPPLASEDLAFETLVVDRYVLVCPLGHPLLGQTRVRWEQLAGHSFIGLNRLSSVRQDIDRVMEEIGEPLDILCDVNQIATVGRMVAAGLGISVLPSLSFRQIANDGIDQRPLVVPAIRRELGMIMRRRDPLSAAASALQEMIRETGHRTESHHSE